MWGGSWLSVALRGVYGVSLWACHPHGAPTALSAGR